MACFIVPAAEAVVVTAAAYAMKKSEEKKAAQPAGVKAADLATDERRIPWSRKFRWLSWLLWGGALLLAYEHVWHGEVVPWFPFLTAMNDPGDTAEMLHEMATIGVTMAGIVTGVWVAMCLAADAIVKRSPKAATEKVPV